MTNHVAWFEVAGKDQPALKSFYASLFDWNLQDMEGMPYSTLMGDDVPTGGIPGGIGGSPDGYPGHTTFYVQVDDLGAALSKVEELGGKKTMGPMDIPSGQIALFEDPEGHVVGLMTQEG